MEKTFLKMYPERASHGVETKVESLKNILSGETPAWEVTDVERAEILSIESDLACKLEPIHQIKTPNVDFDTSYLLTPAGRTDFFEVTGITISDGLVDTQGMETFLYSITDQLAGVDTRSLLELSGRTKKFRKGEIFKAIESTMDESGNVDAHVIPKSSELSIQLNPDLDYSKNEQLRGLKVEIKTQREKLRELDVSDDCRQFLDGVYELYQRKINELLAQRAGVIQNIKNKPDRSGPAADSKWQVIVSDAYASPSVNSTQKILKCPNLPQSLDRLLTVFVAHEIEGHVLQYNNRAEIPLSFFNKIGSDRSTIFIEAGAMDNQNKVAREAFGYTSLSVPHYVKAMAAKLEGGSYADCVDAYYSSTIKGYQELLAEGQIDQKTFRKECRIKLRAAISSVSRLFARNLSSGDNSGHLINSKDTVYLEQTLLADALNKAGFSDILNLAGVNFSTLEFLLKAQLIDLDAIKKPDFYALELWDQMKGDYQLKMETDS